VKGWASLGTTRTKFEFPIPGFQRLLRLRIEMSESEEGLRVEVFDADYDAKVKYYDTID
jgi:hypothetical protein